MAHAALQQSDAVDSAMQRPFAAQKAPQAEPPTGTLQPSAVKSRRPLMTARRAAYASAGSSAGVAAPCCRDTMTPLKLRLPPRICTPVGLMGKRGEGEGKSSKCGQILIRARAQLFQWEVFVLRVKRLRYTLSVGQSSAHLSFK